MSVIGTEEVRTVSDPIIKKKQTRWPKQQLLLLENLPSRKNELAPRMIRRRSKASEKVEEAPVEVRKLLPVSTLKLRNLLKLKRSKRKKKEGV